MATEAKYREDDHLKFLAESGGEDLKILASVLMYDLDGDAQWTGALKDTLIKNADLYETEEELYKNHWRAIAAELQLFGGDSAVNLVRRKGVPYKEILYDVADKIGVDFHMESSSIDKIEKQVLLALFKKKIPDLNDMNTVYQVLKDQGYLGLSSLRDKPLETVKNALGVGAATLPLTAKDITAPAYRITIPAVCVIAIMREKYALNYEDKF